MRAGNVFHSNVIVRRIYEWFYSSIVSQLRQDGTISKTIFNHTMELDILVGNRKKIRSIIRPLLLKRQKQHLHSSPWSNRHCVAKILLKGPCIKYTSETWYKCGGGDIRYLYGGNITNIALNIEHIAFLFSLYLNWILNTCDYGPIHRWVKTNIEFSFGFLSTWHNSECAMHSCYDTMRRTNSWAFKAIEQCRI